MTQLITDTCHECHATEGEPVLYGNTRIARIVRHLRSCFWRGRPAPGRFA